MNEKKDHLLNNLQENFDITNEEIYAIIEGVENIGNSCALFIQTSQKMDKIFKTSFFLKNNRISPTISIYICGKLLNFIYITNQNNSYSYEDEQKTLGKITIYTKDDNGQNVLDKIYFEGEKVKIYQEYDFINKQIIGTLKKKEFRLWKCLKYFCCCCCTNEVCEKINWRHFKKTTEF